MNVVQAAHASPSFNPILEAAAPVLQLITRLRTAETMDGPLRAEAVAAFEQFERFAYERGVASADMHHARFALAASVDEAVLASAWDGRLDWMGQSLQMQYFGEHLAGEKFFARLGQIREAGPGQTGLLELYYVCLQLGFEGVYKLRGLEQLHALQVDLEHQIAGARGRCDARLAPEAAATGSILYKVGRQIPYWVLGLATAGGLLLIYTAYSTVSIHATGAALEEIGQARRAITARHIDYPVNMELER